MKAFILAVFFITAAVGPALGQSQTTTQAQREASSREAQARQRAALTNSSLADLIQSGNRKTALDRIRTGGADVNQAQPDGTRPIHWAVYRVDYELIDALIAKKAKVDVTNEFGSTPLAEAVKLAEQRAEMPRPTVRVEYADPDDPLNPSIAKEPQDNLTADEQSILGKLIGWEKPLTAYSVGDLLRHLPGWFLTAVAVALGAPFWFDVLNKFVKLRNTGRVPPKGEEQEDSK